MRKCFLTLGVCITLMATVDSAAAQTFPVTEIMANGPRGKRINVVFLSEGYTAAEMTEFHADVISATNDLFAEIPYAEYQSYFNVYAIDVPSVESGTDHPNTAPDCPIGLPTEFKDTYFNSTFDYALIHRLLVVQNSAAVFSVLADNIPEWDIVFVVVHSDWYGGSGGMFAVFSTHSSASEVAIHEVGHSFGDLADEYEYGGMTPYESPNTTSETTREFIRWTDWIDGSTPIPTPEIQLYANVVGLFEGAVYQPVGWYRPKLNCKMRALGYPFCEVCREQTVRSIYDLMSTVDEFDPTESTVVLYQNEIREFSVTTMNLAPHTIVTTWRIDGTPVAAGTDSFWFSGPDQGLGTYLLTATSVDSTELVRTDPDDLLHAEVSWTVVVGTDVTGIGDDPPPHANQKTYLYQNTPNPFNPATTIRYSLPEAAAVRLAVFDTAGRLIKTLVDEYQAGGEKALTWDGTNSAGDAVSSGIYFYELRAGEELAVKKMLLLK